jgi:hypothetical protein
MSAKFGFTTYSLYNSASIYLARKLINLTRHHIEQGSLLTLITSFEQFLHNIVAIDVFHKLNSIWHELAKNALFLVTGRCVELALDELGAILIATELNKVVVDILRVMSIGSRCCSHDFYSLSARIGDCYSSDSECIRLVAGFLVRKCCLASGCEVLPS